MRWGCRGAGAAERWDVGSVQTDVFMLNQLGEIMGPKKCIYIYISKEVCRREE